MKKLKKQRAYQDKQLKKKIAAQWKTLVYDIKDNSRPDKDLLAEFKENCELYGQGAPPLWQSLWRQCADTMVRAVELAVDGSFDQAEELVGQAHKHKKSAHKKYK